MDKEKCQFCGVDNFDVIKESGYCDKCKKKVDFCIYKTKT